MLRYKLKAFLPKELIGSYWARMVLGVLVPEHVQVTGDNYRLWHQEKLLRLVRKEPLAQQVLEDMLKNWEGPYFLPTRPKPEETVAMMYEHDRIGGPVTKVTMYLKGQESLEDIVDMVGDLDDPTSQKRLKRELKEMTLWEYLEMTT